MPQRLSEADSSEQAPGAFGFPCCGPAPFASCAFDIIDIGSQVESRQPFQSPEVGLTQSIMAGHVRNRLDAVIGPFFLNGSFVALSRQSRPQNRSFGSEWPVLPSPDIRCTWHVCLTCGWSGWRLHPTVTLRGIVQVFSSARNGAPSWKLRQ